MSFGYDLPREVDAFRALLGELYDDLPERVERLRLLVALDNDFGGSGVMIPGGDTTFRAYVEARGCFVAGHYSAVILLSQALLETLIGAQIEQESDVCHIHGREFGEPLPERPSLDQLIAKAKYIGLLDDDDEKALKRIRGIRNPLTHHRGVDDPTNMTRRMLAHRVATASLFEGDARFCITTVIRFMGKPAFAISRKQAAG